MPNQKKEATEAERLPQKPPDLKQWGSENEKQQALGWLARIRQVTNNQGAEYMTNTGEDYLYYMEEYIVYTGRVEHNQFIQEG